MAALSRLRDGLAARARLRQPGRAGRARGLSEFGPDRPAPARAAPRRRRRHRDRPHAARRPRPRHRPRSGPWPRRGLRAAAGLFRRRRRCREPRAAWRRSARRTATTSSATAPSPPMGGCSMRPRTCFTGDEPRGVVGVYDMAGGFGRIGEFETHGMDLARDPAGAGRPARWSSPMAASRRIRPSAARS